MIQFAIKWSNGRFGGSRMVPLDADDAELESLVVTAAEGDQAAWTALWSRLEPWLFALLRKRTFIGRLWQREDESRDVVVAIMARLRENDFHRLKLYLSTRRDDPELVFLRWLRVLAKRVAIDYLRAHPDYVDQRRSANAGDTPGVWINAEALPSDNQLSGGRPPMTNRVTARQILKYAAGALTDEQRRAIELWSENARADEIAQAMGLASAGEAERLVRAALERLRRYFRKDAE